MVDVDLFAEALVQLIMREDHADLDHVITSMCARADLEPLISLPRFMSLMGVLYLSISMTIFLSACVPVVAFFVRFWSSLSVISHYAHVHAPRSVVRNIPVSEFHLRRTRCSHHTHTKSQVLNATLEDETLMAEFETLIANNDVQALSYEQFLAFARQVGREALARAYM